MKACDWMSSPPPSGVCNHIKEIDMSALDTLARLRRFNEDVRDRDPDLAKESLETAREELSEAVGSSAAPQDETELESIVMRNQRPVLEVRDNDAVLDFKDLGD